MKQHEQTTCTKSQKTNIITGDITEQECSNAKLEASRLYCLGPPCS